MRLVGVNSLSCEGVEPAATYHRTTLRNGAVEEEELSGCYSQVLNSAQASEEQYFLGSNATSDNIAHVNLENRTQRLVKCRRRWIS